MSTAADSDAALTLVSGLLDSVGGAGRLKLLSLVRDLLDEGQAVRERPDHVTLLAAVRLDQERRGVLPNSVEARERRIRAFMAYLEPRHVLDAKRDDVQLWLDGLRLKPMSRRTYLTHVDRFFAWAVEENYVAESPTARITAPRQRRALPRPIANADLARAITAARDETPPPFAGWPGHRQRVLCFLLLAARAGMQNREIASLRVEDIDRVDGILRVRAGHDGEERSIPLSIEVLEALDDLPLPRSGPAFVRYRTGAPVDAGIVNHSVSHHFRQLGITETLRDSISPANIEIAIAAARDESPPPFAGWPGHRRRALCFILLAAYAGLRAQEIAGLCVEDIDRPNGILRVRAGKGDKERNLPLHPELLEALEALPLPDGGPAFVNYSTGAQMRPHNVSHVVNQFFKRLGISATLHQVRHWFATGVYRQNADLRLTQELLGHSSPAVTAIYASFDPGQSAPTVNALSAS